MGIVQSFRSFRQSFLIPTMCLFLAHRSLAPFRLQKTPLPATFNLSIHEPTEYVPDHFFPINPSDLLHDRYEITAKLG